MKRIVVLGSTGSIGTQTLDVVRRFPDHLRVVGLAAGKNEATLRAQAEGFGATETSLFVRDGVEGLTRLATLPEADIVLVSVAGVIGLVPTLAAIEAGKAVALASKEVLVAGGEAVTSRARACGVPILPVDSEHSAIHQCLAGSVSPPRRIVLTCSGGPFRGRRREELTRVTREEALAHPTWRMGGKITLDSATLMNKALEMIEARWLFGLAPDRIEVVVHPSSIVHSMVEFEDGSFLAQLGSPDMRVPISVALFHPERAPAYPGTDERRWDPLGSPPLTFEAPDEETFPALRLARRAMAAGGTLPAVLNAADEEAANAFLADRGTFLGITDLVADVMEDHVPTEATTEAVLAADAWARERVRERLDRP